MKTLKEFRAEVTLDEKMNRIDDVNDEENLTEKFNDKQAEKTLKDLKMVYGQATMVGLSKSAQKELQNVYSRLVSDWLGSNEANKRKIPTELK